MPSELRSPSCKCRQADLVNALVADAPPLCSEQFLALRLLIHGSALSKPDLIVALDRSGRESTVTRVSVYG